MADGEWVELCVVPLAEARRVVARLEGAMLPFTLPAGADGPAVDDAGRVAVFVLAEDLELARNALANDDDADVDAPGGDDDSAEARRDVEERLVEHWICPKCGQRELEVAPLSPGRRRVRNAGLIASALPLVAALLAWAWPAAPVLRHAPGPGVGAWVFVCGALIVLTLSAVDRGRRCRACGWASEREPGLARRG